MLSIPAVLIVGSVLIKLLWLFPKTPEGVDISPVHELELVLGKDYVGILNSMDIGEMPSLENSEQRTLHIPSSNQNEGNWKRINIYQHRTFESARDHYESTKRKSSSAPDKLYGEIGESQNKCFLTYEDVHLDYDHGVPCGFVTSPSITIGFLKNELFLSVDYTGLSNHDRYVEEINADISYLSELLILASE